MVTKNIHYYNGWKTNKAHKINSKVILPANGMMASYSWTGDTFDMWKAKEVIGDIEKVFDYLDGNLSAQVDRDTVLDEANRIGQTKNIHFKYFDLTVYKKGTMHIKFTNQALVDRFNIYCCQKKKWLPPNYGKTTYGNMTGEEKAVVDGFHGDGTEGSGQKLYAEILTNSAYFLTDPVNSIPMLTAG